jgi:carbonic anhydrase/acetyltransferase-like protein (isoleucine patch superfamily)
MSPKIHPGAYIDPSARITGDVTIEDGASVWCNVSIRGDMHSISIGPRVSIQDNTVIHCAHDRTPVIIGAGVLVGHRSIIHGCTIKGPALIGMGSILMDECVIEEEVIVGAGSLVTEGKVMPARHLVIGSPAKAVRPLKDSEIAFVRAAHRDYLELVAAYRRNGLFRGWGGNAHRA